jgi:site-specific recombinase XerC
MSTGSDRAVDAREQTQKARPVDTNVEVWLAELAGQRRQSAHTISAYRRDLALLVELLELPAHNLSPVFRCTTFAASSRSCMHGG